VTTFDTARASETLGPPQGFTLRAMADGIPETVVFRGWHIGTGVWSDPPGRFAVVQVTTVAVYLTVTGEFYGEFAQVPQTKPEHWTYPDNLWIPGPAETLEALRVRLYELRATEREATDMAITEAQHILDRLR
jgi:hypothetical protein